MQTTFEVFYFCPGLMVPEGHSKALEQRIFIAFQGP